jgi:hypothetical protein
LVVGGQEAGEGSAVAAGALHPPDDRLTELVGPGQQLLIAGRGGRDLEGGQRAAELVVGVGDVQLQVGVDPDGELGRDRVWDAGDGCLLISGRVGDGTRAGRADSTARSLGDRLVSGHLRPVGVPVAAAARADRSTPRHQAR